MKYINFLLVLFIINTCEKTQTVLQVGQNIPKFSLYTPQKEKISLNNYRGKFLLLHFWADWCYQCRAEFPKLEKSYKEFRTQNFEIIGINAGQSADHVSDFINHYKLSFPMIMDEDLKISKKYGVTGLPTNYFINKKGKLYKIIIGWVDRRQIGKIIREMKNEND